MLDAPVLLMKQDDIDRAGIGAVIATLERGLNLRDADIMDSAFSSDVLWGSPKGAILEGLQTLNPIHRELVKKDGFGSSSRYELEALAFLTPDIACAHVRRTGLDENGREIDPVATEDIVQEMALYVLARKNQRWWIVAGQNTPVRI